MERRHGIDLLKVVATILIVFHHYQQTTGAVFSKINFCEGNFYFGWVVELFFVISGYLIYLQKDRLDDTLYKFMKKRFIRLFPVVCAGAIAYELFLYIYVCVMGKSWSGIQPTLWGIIIDSCMIQQGWGFNNPWVNNPTWYISVLLLCYLFFYILFKVAKKLKIDEMYLYATMIFIGLSINKYAIQLPFFNTDVCRGYYSFFWGVILARIMPRIQEIYTNNFKKCTSVLIVVLIGIPILIHYNSIWVQNDIQYLMTYIYYTGLLILAETKYVTKLLKNRVFEICGRMSFDVYIWHNPLFILLYICIDLNLLSLDKIYTVSAMCIYTLVCWVIGILSYYCIEQPFARVCKSFALRNN